MKVENKENIMGTMEEKLLIFKMALPMIFSVLVSSLYNIVDSIFIGRIGEKALTAISLGAPISSLMVEISFGIAVGVNAILSRKLGEKDLDGVSIVTGQGFLLMGVVYIIFLLFGLYGVRKFFEIQTTDIDIVNLGIEYSSIVTIFSFGLMMQSLVERLLSSTGKMNGSMVVLLSGAITNIILDPILIFGYFGFPMMGMAGAAIATVIGQVVAGTIGIILNLIINKDIVFKLKSFIPNLSVIKDIIIIAIPTTLTYSINSVLMFFMNQILVLLSIFAPAVYIIYNRVRSFVALPVWGIRNTIISIIAYNLGAKKLERVKNVISISLKFSLIIMIIGTLLFEIIPNYLLRIFSASGDMLSIGIIAFRIIGVTYIMQGISIILSGVFQAVGHSEMALYSSLVQAVTLLGSAFIISRSGSINAIWFSFVISEVCMCIVSIWLMNKISKKQLNVENLSSIE